MASVCSFHTSYAHTSASPAFARCAANKLPTAPQPMMQIFIETFSVPQFSSSFFAGVKLPGHIREALAFRLADAVGVLRIEAHLAIFIHDLRMQRENHVLLKLHVALRADGRRLQHGRADAVPRQMAERKSILGKSFSDDAMNAAGQFACAHQLARRFERLRICIGHSLRSGTQFASNEGTRKFDPISTRYRHLERIEQQVVDCGHAMSWNLERRLRLAMRARKKNVHHAWTRAAGKKTFHSRRHNFRFGLARLVGRYQSPESVHDDVHRVAHLDEFFFTLDCARHVELEIERNHLEWTVCQFAVIAHGHDEIHAINADSLPSEFPYPLRDPLAGNIGPHMLFHPRFDFVADPTGLPRKHQGGFAFERQHCVDVAINNFKTGDVQDSTFETRILIAADDERVETGTLHGSADVFVATIDFELAWQWLFSERSSLYCTPQSSAAVSA